MSATAFTRLATANTYDNTLRNLQTRQTTLSNLQESLTSGKKVTNSADDPTGAAQAERAMNRIARIATDQRALESQRNAIALAESTLGNVTDALQNFRELVVASGNGAYTAPERATIARQLSGMREQILALANTKDSNGLPLFAALGSALAPFVGPQSVAPDYTFNGLPGQSSSDQYAIPFTLDGEAAFMNQPARDGVFNVTVGNTTTGSIPTSRALTTDGVVVNNTATVASTAALAQATAGNPDYPSYTVTFTALDSTTVPGTTTVTYDITEVPPVSGPSPLVSGASASYATGSNARIAITGIPGLSFNINGIAPTTDLVAGATVTGSPAVGDTVSVGFKRSVFSVLDTAIDGIGKAANANAATQAVAQALHNIDISLTRISSVRGQAGDLLGRADRITSDNDKRNIEQEGNRSRAEDLDMIKGISDFQNQQTGYSAALQSYAQVQKLSLFNFIS
ncbi:MAG: flagellar hook-associated protein 3 [Curvibacter sp.]|nr:MAG: flagellar hook-associated protein 3 [Curvibacter sp.]